MEIKNPKPKYRIRNWKEYNKALTRRGSLTIWFDEDAKEKWLNKEKNGKRGVPQTYTDVAIECMSMLKAVYKLPLRATRGLTQSIIELLGIDLPVPCYSTLSRRREEQTVKLPFQPRDKPIYIVVDSTGIKIYGEGEWKVRKHGFSKRRVWRKLHIAVDERSGEVRAVEMTNKDVADKEVLPDLLKRVEGEIEQISGDGAYDYIDAYEAIGKYKARATIPPREGAILHNTAQWAARDENVRRINEIGRKEWKKQSRYHRRSLVETAMFRLKWIFGERMHEKKRRRQSYELLIRCAALNRMTHLGMPESYAVEV
jgi:hypothetical protein